MKKINWEPIKKFTTEAGKVLAVGAGVVAAYVYNDRMEKMHENASADYYAAVDTIMNSDMLSSYKNEAVAALKRNKNAGYYKTVIRIVNSDMLGSNKIAMIKNIV